MRQRLPCANDDAAIDLQEATRSNLTRRPRELYRSGEDRTWHLDYDEICCERQLFFQHPVREGRVRRVLGIPSHEARRENAAVTVKEGSPSRGGESPMVIFSFI